MHIIEQVLQIVSNQGVECPDKIGKLMWANAYVPWDVRQNTINIVIGNPEATRLF